MLVLAVLVLSALFLVKNKTIFKNQAGEQGLDISTETLASLVNKDTDEDGILDWEEKLWGTDPTKKETTEGIPDEEAIAKLKAEIGIGEEGGAEAGAEENLTQTEKFSRELVGAMIALNQNGTMDEASINALGETLAEKIQNPVARKIFLLSDIKITQDNSNEALLNYLKAFGDIRKENPDLGYGVLDVLNEFIVGEEEVNLGALAKLDPIIEQNEKIIAAMAEMSVPQALSTQHLEIMNSLQRLGENTSDIKLFDEDPIVALGGLSQYEKNAAELGVSLSDLTNAVRQELNN